MGAGSTGPQAQCQSKVALETVLSHAQSLQAMKNMARLAVYNVAYLRQLYPSDCFMSRELPDSDGLLTQWLKPGTGEAKRQKDESKCLVDWVEHGVTDAIERGYLRSIYFGIAADPEGKEILEQYVFTLGASVDGGGVGLAAGGIGSRRDVSLSVPKMATVKSVRAQSHGMIRKLVSLCNTLDAVPKERFLFMKLDYQPGTPEDYEPQLFRPAIPSDAAHFPASPVEMSVGNLCSQHHTSTLRIRSLLADGRAENLAPGGRRVIPEFLDDAYDPIASRGEAPTGPRGATASAALPAPGAGSPGMGSALMSFSTVKRGQAQGGAAAAAPVAHPEEQAPPTPRGPAVPPLASAPPDSEATVDDTIDAIKVWIGGKALVRVEDVAREFPELELETAAATLDGLAAAGLLRRSGEDAYVQAAGFRDPARGPARPTPGRGATVAVSKNLHNLQIGAGGATIPPPASPQGTRARSRKRASASRGGERVGGQGRVDAATAPAPTRASKRARKSCAPGIWQSA